MSDFLLVVEGLMADGSDAAMIVSESTYLAALFGHVFDEPVLGYVWCHKHGWVRSDETRVCDDCWIEAMEAQIIEVEFPHGEFDDGAHWRQPAAWPSRSHQDWLTEPCGDPR